MLLNARLGLRVSILLLIASVITTLTIATATSIFFASTHAAEDGARRLFTEITNRVEDRVKSQVNALIDLADMGASLTTAAEPVRGDATDHPLVPFLLHALKQNSNLYAVYVGHANGAFLQAIAVNGDKRILTSNKAPDGTSVILRAISTDSEGKRRERRTFFDEKSAVLGSAIIETPEYDPRSRPWYTSALKTKETILSEPYIFASLQAPGLTASQRAGTTGAVFAVNIALTGLSDFVAQQSISPNGGVVLLDSKRRILAASPVLIPVSAKETKPLAEISEQNSPWLGALAATTASTEAQLIHTPSGNALVQLTEWKGQSGQSIGIGIVSPFTDFTGPIDVMQRRILAIASIVVLLMVPLSMLFARGIARSVSHLVREAARVREFDFSGTASKPSLIREFHELGEAFDLMKTTIATRSEDLAVAHKRLERLVDLGIAMSSERDSSRLMDMILMGAKELSNADGGTLYIRDEAELRFQIIRNDSLNITKGGFGEAVPALPSVPMFKDGVANHHNVVSHAIHEQTTVNIADAYDNQRFDFSGTKAFDERNNYRSTSILTVPLKPRGGEIIGAVQLINARPEGSSDIIPFSAEIQRFVEALSAQAATALYNRDLLDIQERLMDAMIQIIAGAIDAKSPYTGGHCERVPELSLMLAEEACKVTNGPLADFAFTDADQWREFKIGAWLHDCGKVTTPEFVVDKASKLETIHNRIHEVRTRFEVLLRDARISMLEAVAAGTSITEASTVFEATKAALNSDFAFIAECNLGGEFMAPDKVERLKLIAAQTWMRHFDDRLGLAHEELRRYPDTIAPLPAVEPLLADKPYHVLPRPKNSALFDHSYGFKIKIPDNLYNFGEIYNLSIGRGTLTEEERFKITEHVIQTIIMLKHLPFPKHLSRVVEYAGAHHETLIGTGYPCRLEGEEISIPARITALADIFEALTASDRPYKKTKTLSESVKILYSFKTDKHIDPDLFDLFLTSGVYKRYAERYLLPEQIDVVDVSQYLG